MKGDYLNMQCIVCQIYYCKNRYTARVRMFRKSASGKGTDPLDRPYRKILLLGYMRSGSNFLRSLLNSHPGIHLHKELFTQYPEHTDWPDRPNRKILPGDDAPAILQTDVYPPDAPYCAIGFKLFYNHLQLPAWIDVAELLRDRHDFHVIHLYRENLLDSLLSYMIAQRDLRWISMSDADPMPHPLSIAYEDMSTAFHRLINDRRTAADLVAHHRTFDLTYDQLTTDTDSIIRRLHDWLGIPPLPAYNKEGLRKQRTLPKRALISNFDVLRRQCAVLNPSWLPFFEEHVPVSAPSAAHPLFRPGA